VQISIAAPPEKVWALLMDVQSEPNWQNAISDVDAPERLTDGM
jgi:uncharacterized protein YndB with AHSA1/START domain